MKAQAYFSASPSQNGYAEVVLAKTEIRREALNLPAEDRIELVVEIWDSLTPEDIPVPKWQLDLVRDRLADLEDTPPEERSEPWEAVRQRIFAVAAKVPPRSSPPHPRAARRREGLGVSSPSSMHG